MLMVFVLFYIVLLFFYLLYNTGICGCVGRSLCKMLWACFASCFSACEYGCMFLWIKLKMLKQMKREHIRDIEEFDSSEDEFTDESLSSHMPRAIEFRRSLSHRSREFRRTHLRRSLRPRSHRIRVGISRDSVYVNGRSPINRGRHVSAVHNIKVTQTSKFVQKGANMNSRIYHRRRW
ncbi:hypothetical protein HHK36_008947 [Tetracentron sinense]|uniref:Uncharacterized protein n=1 Tax=Tetracentron sinense TaxID=13715 RepID=A0A834ZEG1_TETSI|nr:hypothetical protein HHK36_008947 [Tetracentron sinense]